VYGYGAAYRWGGPAPAGRHWFRTFAFAALIALIPFVGPGASAVYVERRHDPGSFRLGAACGATFLAFLSALGFYLGLGLLACVVVGGIVSYVGEPAPGAPDAAAAPPPPSVEADLGAFWAGRFAAAGRSYLPLTAVVPLDDLTGGEGCLPPRGADEVAALYCPPNLTIFYDSAYVDRPDGWPGDPLWGLVLAHEWGHHVQHMLVVPRSEAFAIARELQATCLAGAYFGDAAARGALPERYLRDVEYLVTHGGDDGEPSHGTRKEQAAAFEAGFDGGPAACGVPL
jgi:hypothetical protein